MCCVASVCCCVMNEAGGASCVECCLKCTVCYMQCDVTRMQRCSNAIIKDVLGVSLYQCAI